MIEAFVNNYLIKEYYSIHVHNNEHDTDYNVIHLRQNKNSLKILDQDSTTDFSVLINNLKKNVPVILSFTGKNVINKVVEKQINYLEKVLFNKNPNDFYIYELFQEENVLLSVARKENINDFLNRLSEHNIGILDFTIGPFIVKKCKPLIPKIDTINTPYFKYDFNPPNIELINKEKEIDRSDFTIGEEEIKNNLIVAFSGFINFLNKDASTNYEKVTEVYEEETIYKKAFNVLGVATLGIFMLLLTISFIVISVYSGKSANIQQELTMKNQVLNQIETLKKDRDYKQSIINNSSLGSTEYLSYYLSQIAEKVPKSMLLQEVNIFPVTGNISSDEKINILPNKIVIKGVTSSKHSVNDWVKVLDSFSWVKKTEVFSYTFSNNEYLFSLNLFL